MADDKSSQDARAERLEEDTAAILSRRRFLIQSTLAGTGIGAGLSPAAAAPRGPGAMPCLSTVDRPGPAPKPCFSPPPPPPPRPPVPPLTADFGMRPAVTEAFAPRTVFSARGSAVMGVAISPDGRTLASISPDLIDIWEAGTGRPIAPLELGPGRPFQAASVDFSPDGSSLVSTNGDTVAVWDLRTLSRIAALPARGAVGVKEHGFRDYAVIRRSGSFLAIEKSLRLDA